jgi:hypothetical protein
MRHDKSKRFKLEINGKILQTKFPLLEGGGGGRGGGVERLVV